jgi:hypothetical protein
MHCCCSLAVNSLVVRGHIPSVVAIISTIYTFCSVMCGHNVLLLLLQSTTLVAAWPNLVGITSHNDNIEIFYQRMCCDGGCRGPSFISGKMALLQL